MFRQGEDILGKMRDEVEFAHLVTGFFRSICRRGRLVPELSPVFMHDAWESLDWDTKRLNENMPDGSEPDHFKIGGFATYWLRRNSPVIGLKEDGDGASLNGLEEKWRGLLNKYSRVLPAFLFGFCICHFIEDRKRGVRPPEEPDWDYIETICYVMKYKNISPHAMGMVYRSFFFGNRTPAYPN